jgi:hypothetical protein
MDKSVIDKMNKEEILELLSPYLSVTVTTNCTRENVRNQYYEMLTSSYHRIRIKLEDDVRYPKGRIDISINMVDSTGVNKWDDIGSVGLSIYPDIVAKYRDMIINKIIQ